MESNAVVNHLIAEAMAEGPKDLLSKATHAINNVVGVLYFLPMLVLTPISTFILSLIVSLPVVGLVIFFVFDVPWWLVFGTLLGSSWLWLKVPFLRPFLMLPGILAACVGDIYVSLIPDMGEKYQKVLKMGFCDSWPY
jgi:hypothetical protein